MIGCSIIVILLKRRLEGKQWNMLSGIKDSKDLYDEES
jgi:hypothetical protein